MHDKHGLMKEKKESRSHGAIGTTSNNATFQKKERSIFPLIYRCKQNEQDMKGRSLNSHFLLKKITNTHNNNNNNNNNNNRDILPHKPSPTPIPSKHETNATHSGGEPGSALRRCRRSFADPCYPSGSCLGLEPEWASKPWVPRREPSLRPRPHHHHPPQGPQTGWAFGRKKGGFGQLAKARV